MRWTILTQLILICNMLIIKIYKSSRNFSIILEYSLSRIVLRVWGRWRRMSRDPHTIWGSTSCHTTKPRSGRWLQKWTMSGSRKFHSKLVNLGSLWSIDYELNSTGYPDEKIMDIWGRRINRKRRKYQYLDYFIGFIFIGPNLNNLVKYYLQKN